jgi:hypothetical protein
LNGEGLVSDVPFKTRRIIGRVFGSVKQAKLPLDDVKNEWLSEMPIGLKMVAR